MVLVPLASVDTGSLRWLRQNDRPLEFDLSAGDQTVGTLVWDGPTGSRATFRTATSSWTLKRVGFLNPHITARVPGSPSDAARLSVHLNYHQIEVAGGGRFHFHRAGVLVPAWKVELDTGGELLHIEPVREGRELAAGAVIASAAAPKLPAFALLVGLSWYFIALAWFEDEAIARLEPPDAPPAPKPG